MIGAKQTKKTTFKKTRKMYLGENLGELSRIELNHVVALTEDDTTPTEDLITIADVLLLDMITNMIDGQEITTETGTIDMMITMIVMTTVIAEDRNWDLIMCMNAGKPS